MTDEWLRQKYETEGLSAVDIAAIVGRDPKSVWTWLKWAGIKTRPRGADPRQLFKKGEILFPCQLFKKGQVSLFKGHHHTDASKKALSIARKGKPITYKSGSHYLAGKTGPQTPNWKGGVTPERIAFYSSKEWKKACVEVWHRADAKCERCGRDSRKDKPKERRFNIHHIVSFANKELRATTSNLVLLCEPCHRFVHSKANVKNQMIVRWK